MGAASEVYNYLSVLISIVIGFGLSQILAGTVRVVHHRHTTKIYWPTILWAVNLFLLLTLVWWSDFSLIHHERWTFAMFLTTLAIPAVLYINASLLLPGSERAANEAMRVAHAAKPKTVLRTSSCGDRAVIFRNVFDGRACDAGHRCGLEARSSRRDARSNLRRNRNRPASRRNRKPELARLLRFVTVRERARVVSGYGVW